MTHDLTGTVIAITGASSGIGAATATLLAERGAHLVLGARREDRLKALAAALPGGEAAFAATDVRRREDVANLVALAGERFGRLDVLVSNAGIGPVSRLDDLRVDEWDAMVDVNLKGVLHGIAAALPVFRAQGRGHFVTVASTAGYRVVPTMAVYAATKTAVRVLTEGLRQEAGEHLRVTTVSPGFVATDFAAGSSDPDVRAELVAARDRMAIPPEAVAEAIAYAIGQPPEVDVNEIVVRPTAQA
ncbi:SDR family oxidoreductase [Cryptosporangium phraense]|uniref:SDR family oxidoreductase n=1 Tax=Cryptosporangium phraense TaxID=2593070 RepID=A0A545ATQ5_9ACTN|nr:SDR family oxidoreductase [Cryptosporangium phraense]TQS44719.1 SDR family oxidoreductase [Cryptosporangium phraense]